MVEPHDLVILGASAPLALKVLGPTADYVGDELQSWTERRLTNLQRIFEKAHVRLGENAEGPGQVPPRVLREVLEGGSYWDDELGAEYFGGLLAASRSELPVDDRAASMAALVSRLSTFQLRTHYLMYRTTRELLLGSDIEIGLGAQVRSKGRVFVPYHVWLIAMDMSGDPDLDWADILQHSVHGLVREGLVSSPAMGSAELLSQEVGREVDVPGVVFTPAVPGVELFCAAHGLRNPHDLFLDDSANFDSDLEIEILPEVRLLHEFPALKPKSA